MAKFERFWLCNKRETATFLRGFGSFFMNFYYLVERIINIDRTTCLLNIKRIHDFYMIIINHGMNFLQKSALIRLKNLK